ncbi:MAG: ATP-grasp domain-containing protein, partial [Bdellovibrio sp.]
MKKVGILGGGQLARMLVQKGADLGFEMHVLSESPEDPAAQVTSFWHQGALTRENVLEFSQHVSYLTFESEFLDIKALKGVRKVIYPKPSLMGKLRDRWFQKRLLEEYGIPTARYQRADQVTPTSPFYGKRAVFKKRLFGYDGYGTSVMTGLKDWKKAPLSEDYIVEEWVPFQRELAVSFARNPQGQLSEFPLVETFQENSRCLWVKGPVFCRAFSTLKKKIKSFLEEIQYVGVIAFELFEVQGQLLVNELAPRVHNSAHYSLNAASADQFTLHLKALVNAPLPSKVRALTGGFFMLNLLGRKKVPVAPEGFYY